MKFIIMSLFILSSCTSLPKGELQLKKMILDDYPEGPYGQSSYIHAGRPFYIESTSYPYLLPDGHISIGGKLLVYVGREELSLEELLPQPQTSNKEPAPAETPNSKKEQPKELKKSQPIFREFVGAKLSSTQRWERRPDILA